MEPLTGRRRALSRFPQYLMKAILGAAWAVAVRVDILKKPLMAVYHKQVWNWAVTRKIYSAFNLKDGVVQAVSFPLNGSIYVELMSCDPIRI